MIKEPARYLQAADDRLCFLAFENLPFRGSEMLSVSLVLFAFATIDRMELLRRAGGGVSRKRAGNPSVPGSYISDTVLMGRSSL